MKNEEHDIEIIERLKLIEEWILRKIEESIGEYIDNHEFLQMMKITARTSQRWMDIGLIKRVKLLWKNKSDLTKTLPIGKAC